MYFLAGIADVEIFKDEELLLSGKTLINSSIRIGVSTEDIRAGKGAKLYGKYFHTTSFNLKISDAMFRTEYLTERFGADIKFGEDTIVEEHFIATDKIGTYALKHTPISHDDKNNIIIYWKHISDNFYKTKKIESLHYDNIIKLGETEVGEMYCVKYLYKNESVHKISIGSEIIPNILSVYLTASLYKDDKDNAKTASKVGTITIKIPKFLLLSNQEILLNMAGAVNNTLEGSALSCRKGICEQSLYYAEIIEVIEDRTFNNLRGLKIYADEEGLFIHPDTMDKKLKVYANFDDSGLVIINNEKIDFCVEDEDILTVDTNGIIHPIRNGTTKITASCSGISNSVYVKVMFYDNDYDNGILISDDLFVYIDDTDILLYKGK